MLPPRPALRRALATLALAAVVASAGTVASAGAPFAATAAAAADPVAVAVTTGSDAALATGCSDGAAGTTLREALCLAAAEPSAVVSVPAGTTVTLAAGPLTYAPAGPATLRVTSTGSWTVDGAGRRILDLDPRLVGGVDVTLEGVELRGGVPSAADAAVTPGGGAVLAGTGDPDRPDALTLRDCVVRDNANAVGAGDAAAAGGAVQMSGGTLTIDRCTFSGNTADGAPGGAVAMLGVGAPDRVLVTGSTFDGNTVTGGSASGVLGGGALFVDGALLTVQGSTLTGNLVTSGAVAAARGGAVLATGTASVQGTRVEGNRVSGSGGPGDGGALWLGGGTVAASVLVGNTDTVTGTSRAASVVGPVQAATSWWGCPAGTDAAGCGAVGVTGIEPRATLAVTADVERPVAGDEVVATVGVVLADGTPAPAALLPALAGRAVAWAFDPVADAGAVQQDAVLGGDATASARFTRGPAAALTVRATVDAVTGTTTLTQPVPPAVTDPAGVTAVEGTDATFTVTATGSPAPALRWERSAPGASAWTTVPGATDPTLVVTAERAATGTRYRVVATSSAGTVTSGAATLSVTWGPEVTDQPDDTAALAGATARFEVGVAGDPLPSVRWQTGGDGTWTDVPGATGTRYERVVGTGDDGLQVRAVLTGATGEVPSAPATLTLHTAPAWTTLPADVTVAEGGTATFRAAASGVPAPALTWQRAEAGSSSWTDVPGATTGELTVIAGRADQGARFRAVATSPSGSATSAEAALVVHWGPEVTGPQDVTVVAGGTARFTITAAGFPAPTVQWQTGAGDGSWADVPGATASVYERPASPADHGTVVRAVVSGAGGTVTTAAARLDVHTTPVFVVQPADATVDEGGVATFTASASGTPAPALRWQSRAPGAAWTDLPGATAGTLAVPATAEADGTLYRALASNAVAADVPSAAATLDVLRAPVVSDPADASVPAGGTARFTVTATGDPAPVVTWETSPDGVTWTAVPGATGPVLALVPDASQDGLRVRAVATATLVAGPVRVTSAAATLEVVAPPDVVATPEGVSADGIFRAVAGRPAALTWVVDAEAGTALWEASRDAGRTWGPVPDGARATQEVVTDGVRQVALRLAALPTSGKVRHTLTYTPTAADDGLMVRLTVTNPAGAVSTDAVTFRVSAAPGQPSAAPGTPGGGPAAGTPSAARPALGVTGSDAGALAAAAVVLLVGGAVVVLAVRRRRA
ncbi:immunoglobulin domain-containing protein [Cellulomonas hominis]|uniref:immunoglobulin domain-containing protein n=1 Tax=Cellulomonas hominis TaxID=156981 RepID=UPI001BCBFCBE|nr:immunoglobulin domain-containing protein [Cellulomonas hominis]